MMRASAALAGTFVALAATASTGESARPASGGATSGAIAVVTTAGRIVLIDEAGRRVSTLGRNVDAATFDGEPAWSPDGRRLAFTRTTDGGRSIHVYVMRGDGSEVRRISRGRFDGDPSWSPDGRWIVYSSESGLRLVHPDGSGTRTVRGTGKQTPSCRESYATAPSWAPGGKLSFSFHSETPGDWPTACRQAGARCGWVLTSRLDGSGRKPVVHGRDAHWSPDGGTIVYTLPDGGIATVHAAGGRPRYRGRGYLADWSADGSQIVFARLGQTAAGDSIWLMNADGTNRHRIMQGATDPACRPS